MNGSLYSTRAFNQIQPDPGLKRDVDKMLKEQYKQVKALIERNKPAVTAIAEGLLEKNELEEEEILARIAAAEGNGAHPHSDDPVMLTVARREADATPVEVVAEAKPSEQRAERDGPPVSHAA
jgi:hypothetical protein